MELWSAFVVGLLGSLHCVGMCGPIAFSLPISNVQKRSIILDLLMYNLGRVLTYSFIGLLVGVFGRAIFFSGYQQQLSVALGSVTIIYLFFFSNPEHTLSKKLGVYKFQSWLTGRFTYFINKTGRFSLLSIGVLNGFLPCGLVYIAITGAFTSYDIKNAVLYMVLFGLGTIPLMLFVSVGGKLFKHKLNVSRVIPYVTFLVGILLILRGLNLDIPYVSPKIEKNTTEVVCH